MSEVDLPGFRLTRRLILLLELGVASAAVTVPEMTVRPTIAPPTTEQQLAQLQQ